MNSPEIEGEALPRKSPRERRTGTHQRGFLLFILRCGIPAYGLPFATLRLFGDCFLTGAEWRGLRTEAWSFLFGAAFFGGAMGWLRYSGLLGRTKPEISPNQTP